MKKFIVLAVAALSMNAFADHHQKHMVSLSGYEGGNANAQDRSLDFSYSKDDADSEVKSQNIALNYAYAFNDQWQAGVVYKRFKKTTDGDIGNSGDDSTTMGLKAIYNFNGLTNSNYLALGYQITKVEEDETPTAQDDATETKVISLEFGHRFSLGNLWGMNFNYSPSVTVAQSTLEDDAPAVTADDEVKTTSVTLNFVKFDVLF